MFSHFIEVYMECPLDVLAARDISDPYEPPEKSEIVIRSAEELPERSAARVWDTLVGSGLISHL